MVEVLDGVSPINRQDRNGGFLSAYIQVKFVVMGKEKTAEKKQARDLFVNSGLNFKEISPIVKVAPRHLSKWAKEDDWETQKAAQNITVEKLISNWYGILKNINDEIISNQKGIPTSAQTDQQSKIADAIFKLSRKNNLSMYHLVLKEFLEELQTIEPDAAKSYSSHMLDFLKRKANHLANDSKGR